MLNILTDTLWDNANVFPFLFATYLLLEWLEQKTSGRTIKFIQKAGKNSGPLVGSLCGVLPQCGFSVVAANLFSSRLITLGTLVAIFLSTSDEMLPIMISSAISPSLICYILLYKIVCGLMFGYLIDFMYYRRLNHNVELPTNNKRKKKVSVYTNIVKPALYRSIKITIFIFIVSLFFNFILDEFSQTDHIIKFLQIPLLGEILSGLLGLIPNCSASIILTKMYLDGYITIGTLISGSLSGAGVGILVLFKVNRHLHQNLKILSIIYVCGVIGGLISNLIF